MRTTWKRRAFALGLFSLLPIASTEVSANGFFARDVVYVAPTDYVSTLATSWSLPTTRVAPTYYATSYYGRSYVPRGYVASSYVSQPTAYEYVPTYYRENYAVFPRFPFFGRRRALLQTAYVYPSTRAYETVYAEPTTYFDGPIETVSTSECCVPEPICDSAGPVAETYTVQPRQEEVDAQASRPKPVPPKVLKSDSEESAPVSSAVPETAQPAPKKTKSAPVPPVSAAPAPVDDPKGKSETAAEPSAADANNVSPPATPAPEIEIPASTPLGTPAEPKVPVAPEGAPPVELPKDKGATGFYQRDARKPVLTASTTNSYVRTSRDGSLHVLEGKVVSSASNEMESGVTVTISNRRQTFADRVAVTDTNGHFKVRLPDGDWTVSVTTKSGKVYPVSELVVDKGQISDDAGETVPSLTITR